MAASFHLSRKGSLMIENFHKGLCCEGWETGNFPCCKKQGNSDCFSNSSREEKKVIFFIKRVLMLNKLTQLNK